MPSARRTPASGRRASHSSAAANPSSTTARTSRTGGAGQGGAPPSSPAAAQAQTTAIAASSAASTRSTVRAVVVGAVIGGSLACSSRYERSSRYRSCEAVATVRRVPISRRAELTDGALRYVLEQGLVGLSLRPLAAALGTSDRMLIYHFGSKDALVTAV